MKDAIGPLSTAIFLGLSGLAGYDGQWPWAALFAALFVLCLRSWQNHAIPPRKD